MIVAAPAATLPISGDVLTLAIGRQPLLGAEQAIGALHAVQSALAMAGLVAPMPLSTFEAWLVGETKGVC